MFSEPPPRHPDDYTNPSETESREGLGDDSSLSAPPTPTIAAGVHMKVDTVVAANADCVPDTADASAAAT
eukprot:3352395-Pleurochrysis_carterae.AAC.1